MTKTSLSWRQQIAHLIMAMIWMGIALASAGSNNLRIIIAVYPVMVAARYVDSVTDRWFDGDDND